MRTSFPGHLTTTALLVLLGLLAPRAASAQGNNTVPPGNSAISQYLESIPTAAGGKPSNGLHHPSGSHSAGGRHGGGGRGLGSAGGSGGGGSNGGGAVSSSTNRALTAQGPTGAADAAFAGATAPNSTARGTSRGGGNGGSSTSGGSVSPAAAVLKSLTGSSGGGLGLLLPVILAVALLVGSTLAALRRRSRASS